MKLISCDESVLDKDFMILLPEAKREQIEKELAAKKIREEQYLKKKKENELNRKKEILSQCIAGLIPAVLIVILLSSGKLDSLFKLPDFLVMLALILPSLGMYVIILYFLHKILAIK